MEIVQDNSDTIADTPPSIVHDPLPTLIIRPSRGWVSLRLKFLAWRDIKVRYKQTVLGAAWAIIQRFFTMVVFGKKSRSFT